MIIAGSPDILADGGSCIAGPDGKWIIEPIVGTESFVKATLDHQKIREEKQNIDPAGYYARPDVTQLTLNRQRQSTLKIAE